MVLQEWQLLGEYMTQPCVHSDTEPVGRQRHNGWRRLESSLLVERNVPTIEQMVVLRQQQQTVVRAQPFCIGADTPRLDVRSADQVGSVNTSYCATAP